LLFRGHEVKAAVRDISKLTERTNRRAIKADVGDVDDLAAALPGVWGFEVRILSSRTVFSHFLKMLAVDRMSSRSDQVNSPYSIAMRTLAVKNLECSGWFIFGFFSISQTINPVQYHQLDTFTFPS